MQLMEDTERRNSNSQHLPHLIATAHFDSVHRSARRERWRTAEWCRRTGVVARTLTVASKNQRWLQRRLPQRTRSNGQRGKEQGCNESNSEGALVDTQGGVRLAQTVTGQSVLRSVAVGAGRARAGRVTGSRGGRTA